MFVTCVRLVLCLGYLIYILVSAALLISAKMDPLQKELLTLEKLAEMFNVFYAIIEFFMSLFSLRIVFIEYKYLQGRVKNGLV
ncbi:hypothetical protein FO519_010155 [Halicephalobus sp. NKZ332]|nr:hypothetical protein FO519_010155 [Halicephalobus sp. NKZ332]